MFYIVAKYEFTITTAGSDLVKIDKARVVYLQPLYDSIAIVNLGVPSTLLGAVRIQKCHLSSIRCASEILLIPASIGTEQTKRKEIVFGQSDLMNYIVVFVHLKFICLSVD